MMIINIFLIAAVMVFVLDMTDFYESVTRAIARRFFGVDKPFYIKPFSCSLCMTFWVSLAYIIALGSVTIPTIALCCLAAYSTTIIKDILITIKNIISFIINKINNIIYNDGDID